MPQGDQKEGKKNGEADYSKNCRKFKNKNKKLKKKKQLVSEPFEQDNNIYTN